MHGILVIDKPAGMTSATAVEHVRPPTMTRIVAGLEAAGLATREPVPGDRRAARVKATARGARLMARGRDQRVDAVLAMLEGVTTAERATLNAAAELLARFARTQGMH